MIKHQMAALDVRKICRNVAGFDCNFAVLHVLWMHKYNLIDHVQFFEQNGANQTIKITSRHQPVFFRLRHPCPPSGYIGSEATDFRAYSSLFRTVAVYDRRLYGNSRSTQSLRERLK